MQNTGTETILFVDDNEDIAMVAKLLLQRFGYTVVTYLSGVEALKTFKLTPDKFDLVISDIGMPGMDGYDLIAEIRRIRQNIPILLCSGSDEIDMVNNVKQYVAEGFLLKPFTMQELSRMTRSVLDNPFPRFPRFS
ncbi:MAG: response regulator [Desulfobacterium sp.]